MDYKICSNCNEEKNINDYAKYKKRDGTFGTRNVCKLCNNKKRGGNTVKKQTTMKGDFEMFSTQELETLKEMIHLHNVVKNKDYEVDRSNRQNRSVNIEKSLLEKAKSLKTVKYTFSDMVNMALKEWIYKKQ